MRTGTNCHLNEEDVEAFSLGLVSEKEEARIDEHLLLCEACQNRIIESDTYVATMQRAASIRRKSPQPEPRPWYFPVFLPLAAAALLVLLMAGLRFWNPGANPAALAVNLAATRGSGIEGKAPAGRNLRLQLDLSGLAPERSLRLELVDHVGTELWQGTVVPQDARATAPVPQLQPGTYFVRAYAPTGQLLREFGLQVLDH
jgi:hypothetical protein